MYLPLHTRLTLRTSSPVSKVPLARGKLADSPGARGVQSAPRCTQPTEKLQKQQLQSPRTGELLWREIQQEVEVGKTQFVAGNIRHYFDEWSHISKDPYILNIIKHGLKLSFSVEPIARGPFELGFSNKDMHFISLEILKLLEKQAISNKHRVGGLLFTFVFAKQER